jgi:hypothetical protein
MNPRAVFGVKGASALGRSVRDHFAAGCAVALLGLALAACSGASSAPPPSASSSGSAQGLTDRAANFLFGRTSDPAARTSAQTGAATFSESDCPGIDVRQGASTFIVYAKGEQTPTNVRYQASVGQTARECAFTPTTVSMKVGMQGRIILGPQGGPGRLDVPIRIALVQEGPEPKTIWTKLYKTRVDIPAGQTNVEFTHVENNLSFPNPGSAGLEAYVIYLGFDNGPAKPPRGEAIAPMPGADPGPPADRPRRGRRGRRGATQ